MSVWTTQPSMVVYCGNWLPEVENSNFRPHAAICLETCHFTDNLNMQSISNWPDSRGILSMGEEYLHTTIHKFEILSESTLLLE
jgi:galactose mutarotase-like enzyme